MADASGQSPLSVELRYWIGPKGDMPARVTWIENRIKDLENEADKNNG